MLHFKMGTIRSSTSRQSSHSGWTLLKASFLVLFILIGKMGLTETRGGNEDDPLIHDRPDADYFGGRIDLFNTRLSGYTVALRSGLHLYGRYDKFYGKVGFQMPYLDRAGYDGVNASVYKPEPSRSGYLLAGYTFSDHELEKEFRMLDEEETPEGVDPHVHGTNGRRFNLELGLRAGVTHYRLGGIGPIKGRKVKGGKVKNGPEKRLKTRGLSTELNYAFAAMGLSHTIFRNIKARFTPDKDDVAEKTRFKRFYVHALFRVVNKADDIYYQTIGRGSEKTSKYVRYQLDDVAQELKFGGRLGYSFGSLKGIGINWNFELGTFPGLRDHFFNFYLDGSFQIALTRILGNGNGK
ncbi:MAG: hypothetical protein ABEH38_08950 [Flavobacteriales bacterium]